MQQQAVFTSAKFVLLDKNIWMTCLLWLKVVSHLPAAAKEGIQVQDGKSLIHLFFMLLFFVLCCNEGVKEQLSRISIKSDKIQIPEAWLLRYQGHNT